MVYRTNFIYVQKQTLDEERTRPSIVKDIRQVQIHIEG